MADCNVNTRPDRWMVYEPHNTSDCSVHVPTHTSLLVLYVIIHAAYLCYAIRSPIRSKQRVKNVLFCLMISASASYLMFVVMTMVLDPDEYGVNGEGAAYAAFWTAWTSWILCFLLICVFVIVVIVAGASAGTRFEDLRKHRKIQAYLRIVYGIFVLLLLTTIYFWAICPHSVEKHKRETLCWQRGCVTALIACIVAGGTAFGFLYKLGRVLQLVVSFSSQTWPARSTRSNEEKTKKMRSTISRIQLLMVLIPPSVVSSIIFWGGMSMGFFQCSWWVVHIVIFNSSVLMGTAWMIIFPLPKKRSKEAVTPTQLTTTASSTLKSSFETMSTTVSNGHDSINY